MKTYEVYLNEIEKVKSFNNEIKNIDADIDIISGRYVVDAKSILGILSMDLSKKLTVSTNTDDTIALNKLEQVVQKYKA